MQSFVQFAYQILGIQLTAKQIRAFQLYEELLLSWNKHTNLTAIRDPEMIAIKHFLDSLTCVLAMRDTAINRVVDVGTGAGFPGIPLKIIYPAMELTLIESVEKKAAFCRAVIAELHLNDVMVITDRAEKVAHLAEHRQKYDWAIARAVASMPTLMEYLLPFVKVGGCGLAMKEKAPQLKLIRLSMLIKSSAVVYASLSRSTCQKFPRTVIWSWLIRLLVHPRVTPAGRVYQRNDH